MFRVPRRRGIQSKSQDRSKADHRGGLILMNEVVMFDFDVVTGPTHAPQPPASEPDPAAAPAPPPAKADAPTPS